MSESREPEDRRELRGVFAIPEGDARHKALRQFVASRPDYGEGHLYLGLSYLVNRFSATLELPMSVLVLGGGPSVPTHARPDLVAEHLQKAEQHFTQAMELDPELRAPATTNLAAVRLRARDYGGAVAYIEGLMRDGERSAEPALRQHLGIAHRELCECERAIALFRSILDRGLSLVHRNLALTYLRQADLATADAEIRAQLGRHDSRVDRQLALAIAADHRGDVEAARTTYAEVASASEYDGHNELLGLNARRRARQLVARD